MAFKDLVVVRIKSQNAFGWSLDSQPSTGSAIIQIEPTKMALPTYLPLSSTLTSIVLQLTQLVVFESIGGYAVDSY